MEGENIRQQLEKIAEEICGKYCKWQQMYADGTEEEYQELLDEKCDTCPLNKLW